MKKAILTLITAIVSLSCYAACISGDCKNGKGVYELKNGSVYSGDFKNGKPHGLGLIKTTKGICKSNWIGGKKEGKAIWKLENDSKLYCSYKNGKKQGKGKLVNADNKVVAIYLWKNGKLIKQKKAQAKKKTVGVVSNEEIKVGEPAVENHVEKEPVAEVKPDLMPGQMISFRESFSYNTGDGSFLSNLMGSYLTADYSVRFYGVVEQQLGDRYKIVITHGEILDPKWASMNYFDYKGYAVRDMNQKIGNAIFMTQEEVVLVD